LLSLAGASLSALSSGPVFFPKSARCFGVSMVASRFLPFVRLMFVLSLISLNGCVSGSLIAREDLLSPSQIQSLPIKLVAQNIEASGARGRLSLVQRERMIKRLGEQGKATSVQRHLAAMSAQDEVVLYQGNEAKLLVDGPATFKAMFAAIETATQSVLLESYIIEDVEVAKRLAVLLAKKRAQGVVVAMIYDALGSFGTEESYFDGLRAAGVLVCAFNPIKATKRPGYWSITHRDHRKILTVDSQWAFTGGINISAVYSSGSFSKGKSPRQSLNPKDGWRDTQVQIRGPAALALDNLVRETWLSQGCEGVITRSAEKVGAGAQVFGNDVIRIVPSVPSAAFNPIYTLMLISIDAAQHSIFVTMAYFAPGADLIDAMSDAATRGVNVQLVLPSVSDFSPVLYAGQSYYHRLLEAGVKIFELQSGVLHAKTAIIDGVVSTIGSSNMDSRSFVSNNEVNAVMMGEDFGAEMTKMFKSDVEASRQIVLDEWEKRSLWRRAKEQVSKALERFW
jgi:cardiolipin synthase A/B